MKVNHKMKRGNNIVQCHYGLMLIGLFLSLTNLYGQRHSHYLGKAWSFGVNMGVSPVGYFINDSTIKPFAYELRLERSINSFLSVSFNSQSYQMNKNDAFVNDGSINNYFITVDGVSTKINNGNGQIKMNYRDYSLYLKKFKLMSSYIPIGFYYSVGLGVASVRTKINKGYEFAYNQYYDNTFTLKYTGDEDIKISSLIPTIGFELGKTMRFLSDNMMLTVSMQSKKMFHKSEDVRASLKNRFNENSIKQIKQYNLFNLKLGVSYVF